MMISKQILQLFCLAVLGLGIALNARAQEKPNILWLTFEDTSPQFIGCYGNADAETPVMDKMAAAGVRFTSAFSTGTVCSPSRSAIITGVPTYKLGSGNHRSNYAIPDFIHGFPKYVKENGYYVTNNSKTDYNVGNVKEFTEEAWDESSDTAGWWNRPEGKPFFSVFNFADSHQSRTMSMSYDWYVKNVLDQMPQGNKQQEDAYLKDMNEFLSYRIPKYQDDKNTFTNLHKSEWIADTTFEMPPIYHDSKAMRKQMARVYNSIKLTDIKMGKLLKRLQDDELLDNTIIFIFADHGEGMPRMKTNGIGLGYRVPFIIWFPEKYKKLSPWGTGGAVIDELIDFEDLAPTLLSLTGTKIPDYMKGRPFLGPKRKTPPKELLLSSDRADNGPDLVRTITDGRYLYSRNFKPFYPEMKYIRYVEIGAITQQMRTDYKNGKLDSVQAKMFKKNRPAEVLYDLKNDPWETENLAKNKKYQSILGSMQKKLKAKVVAAQDILFAPEYELGKISEAGGTPYDFRQDEKKYPIEEIYDIAYLMEKADDDTLDLLLTKLDAPNKFIRYWASLDLFDQKEELTDDQLKMIATKNTHDYPPVQLNLAALVYTRNKDQKSEDTLKKFMGDPDANLALIAINYVSYMDDRKPFVEKVEQVYQADTEYKVKAACLDFLDLEGLVADNKGG